MMEQRPLSTRRGTDSERAAGGGQVRYSRRAMLRAALGLTAAAGGGALLAACGGSGTAPAGGGSNPAAGGGATPAAPTGAGGTTPTATTAASSGTPTASARAGEGKKPSLATGLPAELPVAGLPAPGVPDAYEKLPPPFKSYQGVPGRGSKVTALLSIVGASPTPREQNRYWQELEKRLGITWEPTLVPGSTYDERFATTIAGGDLPDYITLSNTPDQLRANAQGAFADLTPHLTGDALKAFPHLAAIPAQIWQNVTIKGKITGVPKARTLAGSPLLIRQDWAEKFGVPRPRDAAEFQKLMVDFTKGDPDGNGQADTHALGSGVGAQDRFCLTFFSNMFRVPHGWRKNADGTLTNDIETEEFRQTLAYMSALFQAGVFHPDAATMNSQQAKDAQVAGKIGAYGDTITGLPGQITNSAKINPAARVGGLVPPGHDGGRAVNYNSLGWANYIAISAKAARDRERLQELLRIFDYFCTPFGSEENIFLGNGLEGVHHTVQPDGTRLTTDLGRQEITGLNYVVNGPFVFYSPTIPGYGRMAQGLAQDLLAIGLDDPTTGLFSPTNASKGGELNQLQNDRVVAIVTGREPLGALDGWIRDWKSRGGDQIRKEYEQELRS
jgi:putative aldouronate transport system substrate-binding protein